MNPHGNRTSTFSSLVRQALEAELTKLREWTGEMEQQLADAQQDGPMVGSVKVAERG